MKRKELVFKIRFITPAFLGNAYQHAQWRTPPFKAELRFWWRVVYGFKCNFDVDALRSREFELFGSTEHQSNVKIRLSSWAEGKLSDWPKTAAPSAALYLGYGPLNHKKGKGTILRHPPAIKAGEEAELTLAIPEASPFEQELREALSLMQLFGAVGGKKRNGWGSFIFIHDAHDFTLPQLEVKKYCREWRQALDEQWPHAIGKDEKGPLIWKTKPTNLEEIISDLEERRKQINKILKKNRKYRPHNKERRPNTLRFVIRPVQENSNKLQGIIYHMPCRPISDAEIWQKVYSDLDRQFKRY